MDFIPRNVSQFNVLDSAWFREHCEHTQLQNLLLTLNYALLIAYVIQHWQCLESLTLTVSYVRFPHNLALISHTFVQLWLWLRIHISAKVTSVSHDLANEMNNCEMKIRNKKIEFLAVTLFTFDLFFDIGFALPSLYVLRSHLWVPTKHINTLKDWRYNLPSGPPHSVVRVFLTRCYSKYNHIIWFSDSFTFALLFVYI